MERRLAAILSADIVGYSRLMGEDEAGTLSAMRALRAELIEPKVSQYHGRIVKLMGDGALMEFPSAVEAVTFATEVQCAMAERNASVPEDRQIIYRIGINVGDIVIEDGDIFGDGVNIAARLEALAEPGGICVARNVVNQVRDKLDLTFELIGKRNVKNIAQPVTVHRVLLDGKATALATPVVLENNRQPRKVWWVAAVFAIIVIAVGGALWWGQWNAGVEPTAPQTAALTAEEKPSIAVLPFDNMSNEEEQEYFSDGMTEDLITDLSKVSGLSVIARNSTFAYKGQSADVREVGKDLNARYIVEGSVRKADGRVRINAQLIDAETGKHLWANRYDRDFKNIFSLQDEVIEKIIEALKVTLTPDEKRRLARAITHSTEAYDLYLKGLREESYFTKNGNLNSQKLFLQAVEIDPLFAAAYAHLAQAYSLMVENQWADDTEILEKKALQTARRAVELDNELPYAHWSLGRIYTRSYVGNLEGAISAFKRAVSLNPSYADGYVFLAYTHIYSGNAEKAAGLVEKAMRINPQYPFWYIQARGLIHFFRGEHEAAAETLSRAVARNPNVFWLRWWLIACYGQLGRVDDAAWEISEIESLGHKGTIKTFMKVSSLRDPAYRHKLEAALRKAEVPEG